MNTSSKMDIDFIFHMIDVALLDMKFIDFYFFMKSLA